MGARASSVPMRHLILLPGLACDATLWRDQLPVLAARAVSTGSFTRTSTQARVSVTDVHTRHDTVAEMAAAMLAEHPGELVLVGASMGGIVALEAALAAPQRGARAGVARAAPRGPTRRRSRR